MSNHPDYKYNEGEALAELEKYIDSTYDEHYSKNKFQATEFIIDGGHGEGFCTIARTSFKLQSLL